MSYREDIKEVNDQLKKLQDFRTTAGNRIESLEKKVEKLQSMVPKSGETSEKKKPATRKKKLTLSTP
jgi:predicted  nucleic acid-binding Zn-ribbon protein